MVEKRKKTKVNKIKIRFLYFKGCPNPEQALDLPGEFLKERKIDAKIEIIKANPTTSINDLVMCYVF